MGKKTSKRMHKGHNAHPRSTILGTVRNSQFEPDPNTSSTAPKIKDVGASGSASSIPLTILKRCPPSSLDLNSLNADTPDEEDQTFASSAPGEHLQALYNSSGTNPRILFGPLCGFGSSPCDKPDEEDQTFASSAPGEHLQALYNSSGTNPRILFGPLCGFGSSPCDKPDEEDQVFGSSGPRKRLQALYNSSGTNPRILFGPLCGTGSNTEPCPTETPGSRLQQVFCNPFASSELSVRIRRR